MPQTSIIFLKSFIPVPSARISSKSNGCENLVGANIHVCKRAHVVCLAEISKCFPPPSKKLSKYAPIIHVMKVKITSKDLSSLEKSKAIISNLTMVPTVGDIYRSPFCYSALYIVHFARNSGHRGALTYFERLSTEAMDFDGVHSS